MEKRSTNSSCRRTRPSSTRNNTVGTFCGCVLLQRKIDADPRLPFPKDGHISSGKKRLQVNVTPLKASPPLVNQGSQ